MKEYEIYGIRADYGTDYHVGDTFRNSHQWWQDDPQDGSPYDEESGLWDGGELNGTCAIACELDSLDEAIEFVKNNYFGDRIHVIGGNAYDGGNDPQEVIIEDAEVLKIIEL